MFKLYGNGCLLWANFSFFVFCEARLSSSVGTFHVMEAEWGSWGWMEIRKIFWSMNNTGREPFCSRLLSSHTKKIPPAASHPLWLSHHSVSDPSRALISAGLAQHSQLQLVNWWLTGSKSLSTVGFFFFFLLSSSLEWLGRHSNRAPALSVLVFYFFSKTKVYKPGPWKLPANSVVLWCAHLVGLGCHNQF